MLRRAAALLAVGVSIALWVGCAGTENHYVMITIPGGNQVGVYREDPNSGILTALLTSPYALGSTSAPQYLVLHPSHKFLYVANSQESDIALFTILNGALTEVSPRTLAGTAPTILAIDPAGAFLYAGNAGSNSISVYSIDTTRKGQLTPVAGSPFPIGVSPLSMALSKKGDVLYVGGAGGITGGFIQGFSLNAGVPTPLKGSPFITGRNPTAITLDNSGSFLYTANFLDNSISEFAIQPDGTLTELAGSPIGEPTTSAAPVQLIFDPSGKFLFVANESGSAGGNGNISVYTIGTATGSAGGLTLIANSPFSAGTHPSFMAFDPNGRYLMVANQSAQIQVLGWDASAQELTPIIQYATGGTPSSIVVLQ
jgi:6-phosphogluconolactonase (cycloisomerase 2 family)